MKKSKVFEQILNGLVLLGSLAIIIVASIELLDGNNALSETGYAGFSWQTFSFGGTRMDGPDVFSIITCFSCWSRFLTLISYTVYQPPYPIPRG